MGTSRGGATSAPSTDDIHLSIFQGEQEFGDYEAVLQKMLKDVILRQKTTISMKQLHEIYKLHPDDTRYRHKLKLRLKEKLSEKISFFQPNNRCPNVVIASDSIE